MLKKKNPFFSTIWKFWRRKKTFCWKKKKKAILLVFQYLEIFVSNIGYKANKNLQDQNWGLAKGWASQMGRSCTGRVCSTGLSLVMHYLKCLTLCHGGRCLSEDKLVQCSKLFCVGVGANVCQGCQGQWKVLLLKVHGWFGTFHQ